jgi:hypothetical protein
MGSLSSRKKNRQVMALRDLHDKRFDRALHIEISGEFKAKKSSLTSNDTVFAGVETRRFLEHLNTNLLLGSIFRGLSNRTRRDMEKKIA